MPESIVTSAFRRTTETYVSGATTLPQEYFISPDIFAEEEKKIFSSRWVLVGHQSQIAQPGDYFLSTIGGESLDCRS
jgi:phenylpropionate dioxygenase-like ring-hydroxylating dioxygenase large terminal subunit